MPEKAGRLTAPDESHSLAATLPVPGAGQPLHSRAQAAHPLQRGPCLTGRGGTEAQRAVERLQPWPAIQARCGGLIAMRWDSASPAGAQCLAARSRFVRYEPSAWEAESGREDACQQVTSAAPRVAEWLSSVRVRPQCWTELRAAKARPSAPQARTGGAGLQHKCRRRHRQPRAGRSSKRVLLEQLRRSRVFTARLPERLPG